MRRKLTLFFISLFFLASVLNAHGVHATSYTQSYVAVDWSSIRNSTEYEMFYEMTEVSAMASNNIDGSMFSHAIAHPEAEAIANVTNVAAAAYGQFKTDDVQVIESTDFANHNIRFSQTFSTALHTGQIEVLQGENYNFEFVWDGFTIASVTEDGGIAITEIDLLFFIGTTPGAYDIMDLQVNNSASAHYTNQMICDSVSGIYNQSYDADFSGTLYLSALIDVATFSHAPNEPTPAPVPEPATILLLGSGFVLFIGFRKKPPKY